MSVVSFAEQHAKISRVDQQGSRLGAAIQAWAQRAGLRAEGKIADDRLSWELRLRVAEAPPLETEWNFAFDEAVHNLRTALDNAVISIAKGCGVTDSKQVKQLQFPISATKADWANDRSRIKHLPFPYQAAIESVQPFQVGAPVGPGEGGLLLLRDLDNEDKHYLQISAVVQTRQLEHASSVEFETDEGAAASDPPDVEFFGPAFKDGELLVRQRTNGRIAKVRGDYGIVAQVQVVHTDGRQFGVTQVLSEMHSLVQRVLARLESAGT